MDTHWENEVGELQEKCPGVQGRVRVEEADRALEVLLPESSSVDEENALATFMMGRNVVITAVLSGALVEAAD